MFAMTQIFSQETGFSITPIEMQDEGLIFLPKELEIQLGYKELSKTIQQSESFVEGVEYIVLRNSKLKHIKSLLRRPNTIGSPYFNKYANSLIVLTEPGLYTAMVLSRKPNAQVFRCWVTGEVLPSIRKTGMYKSDQAPLEHIGNFSLLAKVEILQKTLNKQHKMIENLTVMSEKQEQFRRYAADIFTRIESLLADSLSPDMFEGWRKIKNIIDEVTDVYQLTDKDRKKYLQELCQIHDVHLPHKAFWENNKLFYTASEIAEKLGIYSINNKPHARLVTALIDDLNLERNFSRDLKYSNTVVQNISKWLKDHKYPEIIKIATSKGTRTYKAKFSF